MSSILTALAASDPKIAEIIRSEESRQGQNIELIASENFVSPAVLEAAGSVLTNKYAEGYPHKRYYGGCEFVDQSEELAIARVRQLFQAEAANVQPHSGSQANMGVYYAELKPGDTILAMDLAHGGHLTHGSPVNFSGKLYKVIAYGVDPTTERIDYDQVRDLAKKHSPKMIVCGASNYSRVIDFRAFREAADRCGAVLMADIAHIAGLVAKGFHPSPIPHCDYVTSTTHKTLRGPRGGIVLCREAKAKVINSQLFPGIQGGPLCHIIAAKAVAFGEALRPEFTSYIERVVANTRTLAAQLESRGFRIVSGGTDNHLFSLDLSKFRDGALTGKKAESVLDAAGITVNKNMIPFDRQSPFVTSGIRIGTAAVTTRGMNASEMTQIADWITLLLSSPDEPGLSEKIRKEIQSFTSGFPLFSG